MGQALNSLGQPEERRALLSGAEVVAYPSRYEGFGFPVLEAFAALPHPPRMASFVPTAPPEAAELLQAYLGMQPSTVIRLRFCWLDAATREDDGEAWFVLRVDVD